LKTITFAIFGFFLMVAITQILASFYLWIDAAYFLHNFMGCVGITLLVAYCLIGFFRKFNIVKTFKLFLDKASGAFIMALILNSFFMLCGVNGFFSQYYSQLHRVIYVKDGGKELSFVVYDKQKAKDVAEKLKAGDINIE
jgi:hypothetical protein